MQSTAEWLAVLLENYKVSEDHCNSQFSFVL